MWSVENEEYGECGVWKMRSVWKCDTSRSRVRPVNTSKHLYKYFVNFDIKCSQNQTLKQADLDLSFQLKCEILKQ